MFFHLKPWQHGKLLFFHSYECQGIKTKNLFDKILNLSFNFRPLKNNTYGIKQESILQKTIKNTHIIKNTFDGKKIKRIKTY